MWLMWTLFGVVCSPFVIYVSFRMARLGYLSANEHFREARRRKRYLRYLDQFNQFEFDNRN